MPSPFSRSEPTLSRKSRSVTSRASSPLNWQEWPASNRQPAVLETAARPLELHSQRSFDAAASAWRERCTADKHLLDMHTSEEQFLWTMKKALARCCDRGRATPNSSAIGTTTRTRTGDPRVHNPVF